MQVRHGIGALERDMRAIPLRAVRDMRSAVRKVTVAGNAAARSNARRTAGAHGKHYKRSFTWDVSSFYGAAGGTFVGEYGPDASRQQGKMSFEGGSRNQPPHHDLAKSADLIGPTFAQEVHRLPGGWFW
ncbi:MAG: hypothetical protein CMH83_19430 [Nocardioides sp.]|nr:hypothetical protein [Nocardioides sp.]MBS45296.1 hypothetical protein [Nocardioides sp.]